MLISFIIPHYNLSRELLQDCIDSIVALHMPASDHEIVVVDDGSDMPPEWIEQAYPNVPITLIAARHGGPGAARNHGMEAAQGEYIQFVDADDSIAVDAFAACLEILKREQPDILQHSYRTCHCKQQAQQPAARRTKLRHYSCAAEYVSHNNLSGCPWMYIFRKAIADNNNIRFAEGVMHEDEDFNTKIYYYGKKLIVCNCIAYNYCRRESSITTNSDSLHEARRISHLFRLLERLTAFRFEQQEVCSLEQRAALNRKLTMLTVDTLLNLFYNDWSAKEVEEACHEGLYPLGLYPLPDKNYSLKYRIFAALSNSRTGLKILRRVLPSQKPQ